MDDRDIIDLYWARDQRAVGETAAKYGPYCAAVADNILHDSRDTEECVNDTWLKAWNAMPPQRPQRLKLFLARITRNLAFDRWRKGSAQRRGWKSWASAFLVRMRWKEPWRPPNSPKACNGFWRRAPPWIGISSCGGIFTWRAPPPSPGDTA